MQFFTIGVYNWTEAAFFRALKANEIDTFCDIRQRRGVRGSRYSFVNSSRLQQKIAELNIQYDYVNQLAPTAIIRELQKTADQIDGVSKTQRKELGHIFVKEYKSNILEKFDFYAFFSKLSRNNANRIALFCVEEHPMACHRSVVADKLTTAFDLKVIHIRNESPPTVKNSHE